VDATGIVEKFYQGMPIIEIQSLSGQQVGMVNTGMETDVVLDTKAA
jgi:hypothetical protein